MHSSFIIFTNHLTILIVHYNYPSNSWGEYLTYFNFLDKVYNSFWSSLKEVQFTYNTFVGMIKN